MCCNCCKPASTWSHEKLAATATRPRLRLAPLHFTGCYFTSLPWADSLSLHAKYKISAQKRDHVFITIITQGSEPLVHILRLLGKNVNTSCDLK